MKNYFEELNICLEAIKVQQKTISKYKELVALLEKEIEVLKKDKLS